MLDAIALYFRYRSSRVTSLRIVTTDLDLLPCASRKGKTDSDLIRNALLLWNNVVLCATFERKRVRFRFLRQCQCKVIRWHTTKLDQFTSESVSNSHTVNIELQEHYWKRKSRPIGQKRCSRIISYRQHESNHHKLRQKANLQRDEITMIKCLKKQHQEGKSVSKAHIECESKS